MKIKSPRTLALFATVALFGAGCASAGRTARTLSKAGDLFSPPHYLTPARAKDLERLNDQLGRSPLSDEAKGFVYRAVFDINQSYGDYIDLLTAGRAGVNIAYDTVNLGLTGASTAFTPAKTKTILSGLATFFQGQKKSVDHNLFNDQAIFALTAVMEARRAENLRSITSKMDMKAYSLGEALIDIETLDRAGCLQSALHAATATATTGAPRPATVTPGVR
ncbi:MAG: hypothetical protein HZA93_22440 [Verrucomicrobia bacterium]|nr:hypothetical protein [Verrucomicrobiota bacterium]